MTKKKFKIKKIGHSKVLVDESGELHRMCGGCRKIKPLNNEHFPKDSSKTTGYYSRCFNCNRKYDNNREFRSGIYSITCTNGRVYIGSSKQIEKRWKKHRSQLGLGDHPNSELQSDWNKLGEEHFEFKLIHETSRSIGLKEKIEVKRLQRKGVNVYNTYFSDNKRK